MFWCSSAFHAACDTGTANHIILRRGMWLSSKFLQLRRVLSDVLCIILYMLSRLGLFYSSYKRKFEEIVLPRLNLNSESR